MAKRKPRDDEIQEEEPPPAETKSIAMATRRPTTRAIADSSSGVCDDVLRSIFARVPARTAVASMAISKHHRRLMRCPDFISLHCRLSPPLPRPHVAYVATAKVRRSHSARGPVTGYHVAGGAELGGSNAPMRALAGPVYVGKKYVNTCNGVVLLAGKLRTTCVLWNPAIADEEKQVTVPVSARDDCEILGLGYGPRTKTYKLLLTCREKRDEVLDCDPPIDRFPKELLVYALGGAGAGGERPRLRSLLSKGLDGEISGESLYMDGTLYLLHIEKSVILDFDVDDETVTTIDLPGERHEWWWSLRAISTLLVMSGRPCVDFKDDNHGRALWLLTAEHQWEMRCIMKGHHQYIGDILSFQKDIRYSTRIHLYSIAGVWDCGGVLVMYLRRDGRDDKLFLCCTATKKLIEVDLPFGMTPERPDYAFCWGYKPTLVTLGSVVGERKQDEERRRREADIMAALKPVHKRDGRVGQKATLDTVCFMEFLLRIMRKLPENLQDVTGIPFVKSEDSDPSFENEFYSLDSESESDSSSSTDDEIYH